jgi:mRNA-degrading endonuclease HigB of HigAB toxin-antitoxin module
MAANYYRSIGTRRQCDGSSNGLAIRFFGSHADYDKMDAEIV